MVAKVLGGKAQARQLFNVDNLQNYWNQWPSVEVSGTDMSTPMPLTYADPIETSPEDDSGWPPSAVPGEGVYG